MRDLSFPIFLTITLIIGLTSCKGDNKTVKEAPGDAIEEFYRLIQTEEYKKAAQMCSRKGRVLNNEEAQKIERMIGRSAMDYNNKDGIKEVILIEETTIGDYISARVKYNIVYNNGDEDDKIQALEKIDERWYLKIVSF